MAGSDAARFAGLIRSAWNSDDLGNAALLVKLPQAKRDARDAIDRLWRAAARTDSRIEPIPCGERQWREDNVTPILEVARKEGVCVPLDEERDETA